MTDLRALAKKWGEASLERLPDFPVRFSARRSAWPMVGMFSAGLVLGALAFFAVTHRSEIARALTSNEVELDEYNGAGDPDRISVTTHRPNNRRTAAVENS